VLLDCAAEVNVVSHLFAVEHRLKTVNAELPTYEWLNQAKAYCYEAYEISLRLKDSWGRTQEVTLICYGMIDAVPEVTLGMPGLKKARVLIDCEEKAWRWKLEDIPLILESPRDFAESLQQETRIFALVASIQAPSQRGDSDLPALPRQLEDYREVFSTVEAGKLPQHQWGDHPIDLEPGQEVPYGPLYHLSTKELEVLRNYIEDAKAKGWIRESTSPAGAPVLFVPKKDGTLRLCVDYRGLNKITVKNRLALPLISETLDRLSEGRVFTKLDLKDAYHRIRIRRGDEWKTAFRTRYGHFEYTVMPFGLTNAPATFQGYINRALSGLVDVFCVVYLDDILIFSDNEEEHWKHVAHVLERLQRYRLYANLKKCQFAVNQVEFLGFIVSTDGVSMDPSRVDVIVK
jgi:hypothetical protein